jgi:hypothetical protein
MRATCIIELSRSFERLEADPIQDLVRPNHRSRDDPGDLDYFIQPMSVILSENRFPLFGITLAPYRIT